MFINNNIKKKEERERDKVDYHQTT